MSRLWSDVVGNLAPYVPGEQPRAGTYIKLNTNENAYGPSPLALEAIAEATAQQLCRYPDPGSSALRKAIGTSLDVSESEVFLGNGSDEVLAHVFHGLLKHVRPTMFPDVTYGFYASYCRLYGINAMAVPLDETLRVKPEMYAGAGAVILANPNAPTGIALSPDDIEHLLLQDPDRPVVVDEAYVDFGAESVVPLVRRYPNLLVVQTFSKSRALAGLRVGFAVGQRPLIEALERIRDSFNAYPLGRLAQAGALAAWHDTSWLGRHRQLIIDSRSELTAQLLAGGWQVFPSSANFIFAGFPGTSGQHIASQLRDAGILVRHFPGPRTEPFVRITIGTTAECLALSRALASLPTL
jgi:histidinol-phosphate aminotransferase